MNSISVHLHGYCNKSINLHNYIYGSFLKPYKFYSFFYYTPINVGTIIYKCNKTVAKEKEIWGFKKKREW